MLPCLLASLFIPVVRKPCSLHPLLFFVGCFSTLLYLYRVHSYALVVAEMQGSCGIKRLGGQEGLVLFRLGMNRLLKLLDSTPVYVFLVSY